ncbi:MAG TPA: hypothetical protein VK280_01560 [Streptosporangiaceae bacterium]|nr:hypothetical protein [Streptosporangiaceae bacterium]
MKSTGAVSVAGGGWGDQDSSARAGSQAVARGLPWFSASRPSTYIRPRPIVSEFVVPVTEAVI